METDSDGGVANALELLKDWANMFVDNVIDTNDVRNLRDEVLKKMGANCRGNRLRLVYFFNTDLLLNVYSGLRPSSQSRAHRT